MRAIKKITEIVGVLSMIGMVLVAIITTRTDYAQYRIGGRE